MKRILFPLMIALLFLACQKDSDSSDNLNSNQNNTGNNNPAPDVIATSLILPQGAEQVSGGLPAPAPPEDAPTLMMDSNVFFIDSTGSTSIGGRYGNAKRRLGGASLQVSGASFHHKVPIQTFPTDSTSGTFRFDLGYQSADGSGDFILNMNIYDTEKTDLYSLPVQITVKPFQNPNQPADTTNQPGDTTTLPTDTSILNIQLSWVGDNAQRLFVVDPNSDTLSFMNDTVNSGGKLVSLVPIIPLENALWSFAPDGDYFVIVEDEGSVTGTTTGSILITSAEESGGVDSLSYNFTHTSGQREQISHFRRSGFALEEL